MAEFTERYSAGLGADKFQREYDRLNWEAGSPLRAVDAVSFSEAGTRITTFGNVSASR